MTIAAPAGAFAYDETSAAQMKSCKNSVAHKHTKPSMADISVSPKAGGKHNQALVAWTVDLDGYKTRGTCTLSDDGHALKIATTEKVGGEFDMEGFYYDRHAGKWRDPAGDIYHTRTPESGVPRHGLAWLVVGA